MLLLAYCYFLEPYYPPIRPMWAVADGIGGFARNAFGGMAKSASIAVPGIAAPESSSRADSPKPSKVAPTVRKLFPESWLWTTGTSLREL